jgi:signal transduction histidine kinase
MVNEPGADIAQDYTALQFEKPLSEASAAFIRASGDEIDSEIERWLQRAAATFGIHKATLVQLDPTDGQPRPTHQWVHDGVTPNNLAEAAENYPWLKSKILSGEMVVLDDVNDAPPAASYDLQQAHKHGGKAAASIPLRIAGQIAGAVVFTSVVIRSWPPQTIQQLQRITEIFGIALERERCRVIIRKLQDEIRDVLRIIPMAEMTSALAHELNQPLGAILNNGQAARRLLSAKRIDIGELRDAVEAIIRDVGRVSDIVRHTREAFQSVSEGRGSVELREVLLDVERVLRNDARARGISLRLSMPTPLPCVVGNRQGLLQVLMNLVLNAFDSVSDCSEGPRAVEISAVQEPAEIRVRVRDTGKGIDPQIMPRLFNAFITTKSTGTGMGLAIARSIIEKSGGRIWAVQKPGPGAAIEFALPLSPGSPANNSTLGKLA